jgi:hypothetical protein
MANENPKKRTKKRIGWYSAVLHLALIALAIQVVVLTQRNGGPAGEVPETIAAGDAVEPIPVVDLEGRERTVRFDGKSEDTLLFVFTTTCPACKANVPAWIDLYQRLGDRFDVVGISVDDPGPTVEYIAEYDLPYPVVTPADPVGFPRRYRIPGVPQTLRIGPDGEVRGAWIGPLTEEQIESLAPRRAAAGGGEPAADERA